MKNKTVRGSNARRSAGLAILGASIFGASAITVRAVSWYWDSTTNNWSSPTDWIPPGPVGPPLSAFDTTLNFGGSGATGYTATDDLTGAFTLNSLILNSSASVAETVTVAAGNSLAFEANSNVNPTVTNSGAGSFTIGAPMSLGAATTFGGTGTGTITVSGVVSGGALTVSGGHYALSNIANSFSGLTVTGGVLEIAAGAGPIDVLGAGTNSYFGAGPITINGGELRLTTTGNTANNVIFNTTPAQTINFGTAGGILNVNGMDNTTGLNITLANAASATAVVKFAGGAQGFDGPAFGSTVATWSDDINALRFTTIAGATASTPLEIDVTNGAELALSGALGGAITEPLTISGVAGGNESAGGNDKTTGRVVITVGPYTFSSGLFLSNTLQLQVGGGARVFNGNITLNPGANIGFQGRGTATAISTPEQSALELGTNTTINASTLTVSSGATAAMDLRFRTDLANAHGIQLFDKTNILAGGTLAFTQSYTNTASGNNVGWVEVGGNIVGNGTTALDSVINLLLGAANTAGPFTDVNGVVFDAGSNLVVNGAGFGGLKVMASGAIIRTSVATGAAATYLYGANGVTDPTSASTKVSNLLTAPRLAALTGSGGYLTPAASGATWNFPAGGEWGAGVTVGLQVSNSNANGASVSLGALTSFQHNIAVDAGATLDTGTSNLTFGPASVTPGLGLLTGVGTISGAGGITINTGATVLPGLGAIGTLTVGNITINGALQIATTNTPSTDLLAVNGNLTLGASSILNLPGTNTYSTLANNYTLATFSGLTGTFGSVLGLPNGYQVVYGSNSITLQNETIVSRVWNGNISGAWDVNGTANWQGSTTFANNDAVTFNGTAAGPNFTVTVTGGNVSPGAITVDTSAHNYTLVSSAAAQITGPAILTKNGSGILTLTGPATYGGGTIINNGTLALGSNNALPPTGPVSVASGAILDTQGFSNVLADLTVNGAVNGAAGTLTVNSLTLGSAATFAPNLVLHGALTANNPNAMVLAGNIDLGGAAQTFTVTAGTAPELTLNGVVSDGGLTKAGNGTLVLANAANSYTGGTIVNAGTLSAPLAGSLPSGTAVTINGGTLDTNANPLTVSSLAGTGGTLSLDGAALNLAQSGNSSFEGSITGAGTVVTKTLGGALVLSGSGSTFSGGLNVNAGVLIAGAAGAVGSGTVTVNSGGDFQVGVALTAPIVLAGGTLSSQGTTQVTNSTLTASSNSVILLADATNLGTTGDMPLTGTLAGTGNLSVTAGTSGASADVGPGFRLRGTAPSAYSGTITTGPFAKVEMQTAVAGPFSPAGSGNFVLTGGSYTTGTVNGNYSEILIRNNFAGDTILGNNVSVTGTVAGGTAWGFINLVSGAPGPNGTDALGSVNQLGNLTLGDGQGLGVYRNVGNINAAQFTGVTLTGGTSTLAADPIGFAATGTANLILGPILETAPTNVIFAIGQSTATTPVAGTILLNSANTYSGSTTIATGSTGTLALGAAGALPVGTALTINGGTLDMNYNGTSNDQTVASLAGSGGTITNSDVVNTRTFTVNQSSAGGPTTFSGQIQGNLNFAKAGSGTLILANGGSYSGQTTVTGGVLSVNGSLSSPMVTVVSGALNGTGVLSGAVTVGTGAGPTASAIIDPADNATIGTLTTGPLSLANSDAAYVMELNSSTLTSDTIMANGSITLGIGLAQFIPSDLGSAPLGPGEQFVIAQSTTGITGAFANFPEGQQFALNGNIYAISYLGDNGTEITLTSVPEPGAASALATGVGLLAGLARFRRRSPADSKRF